MIGESVMDRKWKILVTEKVGEAGLDIFRNAPDVELDVEIGLAEEELIAKLPAYDGILTRSGTTMDERKIEAGKNLKVIGRAGVGVDNIDLPAASRQGIIVINAPSGNTLAATELTMANMLAVVRHVPQACSSLHRGKWDRNRFTGCQLSGRKLLIIGLGRIGSEVAKRARAFGMEVIAYDPYIPQKKAESLHVELVSDLEGAVSLADVVTIHTPLTQETSDMIDADMLRAFKHGAYLVNCARGGIVDEAAVAEAVRDGRLSGFATDVFSAEPLAAGHPFLAEDIAERIVITPHIGANTVEAQSEVSRIAAQNMLMVLRGEPYSHAVNLPFIEQALNGDQRMYLALSRKIGVLAAKLAQVRGAAAHNCHVTLRGALFEDEEKRVANQLRPYTIAVLKGMLEVSVGSSVTYMIAPLLAKDRHISIDESCGESKTYKNTIEVELETEKGSVSLLATITEEGRQRIVRVNDYWVDFVPSGKLLIFQNHDRPGVIGKIGSVLGAADVNIANFALGRKEGSGLALGALEIDGETDDRLRGELVKSGDMVWVTTVDFTKAG
ncbi:phosphoglycerate dehydrogenase [Cloacibacillus evryensis]|uniref:phosphoglycerate dehydrogenase n=2 Tax=Cloacibacillus evryensis TaxID=508460 RepID=UPI00241C139F|nr:phosphoglycerate dehydrogenase [Cloacibacillus evryensis]